MFRAVWPGIVHGCAANQRSWNKKGIGGKCRKNHTAILKRIYTVDWNRLYYRHPNCILFHASVVAEFLLQNTTWNWHFHRSNSVLHHNCMDNGGISCVESSTG